MRNVNQPATQRGDRQPSYSLATEPQRRRKPPLGAAAYTAADVWDPVQYGRFEALRARPAAELLARIRHSRPARVVDLGCGPGTVTALLANRWPDAEVVAVDSSAEMLAAARRLHPGLRWRRGAIETWDPPAPVGVIFSNAALHWVDGHAELFPRLVDRLERDGWLGVQMPRNHAAASHTAAAETARAGRWRARLEPRLRPQPVGPPEGYVEALSPLVSELDVWETEYYHVLDGDNPVAEWTRGSLLRPLLAALEPDEQEAFWDDYAARVLAAYPPRSDGTTLFPFRRLFVVARR